MPQNKHTVRVNLVFSADQVQKMNNDKSLKVLLYCGIAQGMSPYHPVEIAFPNQVEVKLNDDDVKSNFKGLKNKPGSTKPAELTNLRYKQGYSNQLSISYALTNKRYAFVVYLVRYISAATLTERIKSASIIAKRKVIEEMSKANADADIEATSTRMSLKDPISTIRITLPVRSTVCTHIQCFDGAMFMQLQEQAPQWACPVCSKSVSFQSLCVDKYFEDILNNTSKAIEKVDVEPNGEWRVIREDEDSQPNGTSNKARASYDDDFDDDLVVVPDPTNKHVNGLMRESQPPHLLSPINGHGFSMNTPPISSREPSIAQSTASAQRQGNKRSAGAVIDLTLSDEEEEQPPRPAKRQATATSASHPTQSYHTPVSIPDPNRYPPPYPQRPADNYRPPSHGGPPPSPHFAVGGPSSSTPQSPARPNVNGIYVGDNAWAPMQFRPPSQPPHASHPFGMGPPPPEPGRSQTPLMPQQAPPENLRLPRMQMPPQGGSADPYQPAGGWRSGSNPYSNSPGG